MLPHYSFFLQEAQSVHSLYVHISKSLGFCAKNGMVSGPCSYTPAQKFSTLCVVLGEGREALSSSSSHHWTAPLSAGGSALAGRPSGENGCSGSVDTWQMSLWFCVVLFGHEGSGLLSSRDLGLSRVPPTPSPCAHQHCPGLGADSPVSHLHRGGKRPLSLEQVQGVFNLEKVSRGLYWGQVRATEPRGYTPLPGCCQPARPSDAIAQAEGREPSL